MSSEQDYFDKLMTKTKSKLSLRVRTHVISIKGRGFNTNELTQSDFKRSIIKGHLLTKSRNRWKTNITTGMCSTGMLSQLKPSHLEKYPIPLSESRKNVTILTGLLTGHINLQSHLYKLGLTYTPTCTCLREDETVHHYLYNCTNYKFLRAKIYPDFTNYNSVLQYVEESGRLS